ncbi:transcription intermediary factor 1-beta-like [Mytilus edulis]|uniref:transcription intermediary factor 1-beta-like n=1 Tax=Mytilus edulis TaxID=6550 RepID=UPI0039EF38E0
MATSMAQVPLQKCEICEINDGRRYCTDCEQYFCKTCEEFHLKSKSCRNHVFQDLGQINPEEKKLTCKEHNKNMTYYCTTCSMLVCKICLPKRHKKHDFTLTSEAAFKFKTDLKDDIEQMNNVVRSIAQQRANLDEKTKQYLIMNQNLVQEINEKGNELKNAIDKIVCDKVADVKYEQQVNLQKKTDEERFLKDAQDRRESVILMLSNAVENKGDTMLLSSRQSLQEAMQSMLDIVKSDVEFPALSFEDGLLNEKALTQMIGSVVIPKADALLACKRSHIIDKCKEDSRLQKFKSLPPLILSDIDINKVQFLANSSQYKAKLEQQLKLSNGRIIWPPSISDSKIVIECTLTKEKENCRKLAMSWEEDIRKQLSARVGALVIMKHTIKQEAWSVVLKKLREVIVSDSENVTVRLEKPPAYGIIVVGYEKAVKEVSGIIQKFRK